MQANAGRQKPKRHQHLLAVAVAAGGAAAATAGGTLPFVVVGWRSLQDFC